eukprot:scaffold110571_cov47-Attheya_sp.AAC.2
MLSHARINRVQWQTTGTQIATWAIKKRGKGRADCIAAFSFPRKFSSSDEEDDAHKKRHSHIQMNPNGYSKLIEPGDFIIKKDRRTGEDRKDLKDSKNKPILSNETAIPAQDAKLFPSLSDVSTLTGEKVDTPSFFTRNNQGRLQSYLSGFITSGVRKNTPEEKHSRTLLYFGDKTEWRDTLRMHNTLTGYVFLLDGMGRVRWAGSGSATEKELNTLTSIAKELTPLLDPSIAKQQVQKQKSHVKRRPPRPK